MNAPQARIKETDRIACMTAELRKMGIKVEELEDDVFITSAKARGALNGDRVRIAVTKPREGNRHADGTVLDIIERTKRPFVGVLHIIGAQAWVIMQSKFMPYDVTVDVVDPKGTPLYRKKTSGETTERRELKGALEDRTLRCSVDRLIPVHQAEERGAASTG